MEMLVLLMVFGVGFLSNVIYDLLRKEYLARLDGYTAPKFENIDVGDIVYSPLYGHGKVVYAPNYPTGSIDIYFSALSDTLKYNIEGNRYIDNSNEEDKIYYSKKEYEQTFSKVTILKNYKELNL